MKFSEILVSDIIESGRWRVENFLSDRGSISSHKGKTIPLGEIYEEISVGIDPAKLGSSPFIYLGLENVESVTGDLVGDIYRQPGEIKSRSKSFRKGDVLYGRLRPALRKAIAITDIDSGLCSTEFLVLRPKKQQINPLILRALLASKEVGAALEKLQIGAALPRVSPTDLLKIHVPLIAEHDQQELIKQLKTLALARAKAKAILASAGASLEAALEATLSLSVRS